MLEYTDGEELKIEFTKYFPPQFPPTIQEKLRIDSIEDIFLNKIACIFDRNDPKDRTDMYVLLKDFSLSFSLLDQYFAPKF